MERIGILGGTGAEGRGIALRLALAGHEVCIGSRSEDRAKETAESLGRQLPSGRFEGWSNDQVARIAKTLFLAVPFDHAASTLKTLLDKLHPGQLVVDVTVPLDFRSGPRIRDDLGGRSGAEFIAGLIDGRCGLAATFKTVPAHLLEEIEAPLDCDEFICAATDDERRRLKEVVSAIPGIRWIDAGPLHHCRALEAMTAMIIGINRRYKAKHGRFRVIGLEAS